VKYVRKFLRITGARHFTRLMQDAPLVIEPTALFKAKHYKF